MKSPFSSSIRPRPALCPGLRHLLTCGVVATGVWGAKVQALTEIDLISTATDLSVATNYDQNAAPVAGSDIAFGISGGVTGRTYTNTTFNLSTASITVSSLNDLDTAQTLTITNGTAARIITFNAANGQTGAGTGTDSVPGSQPGDFIYVAPNANLRIQNGTAGTLTLNLPNTNTGGQGGAAVFDVGTGGSLTINSVITTTGASVILIGGGTVTFGGANSFGNPNTRSVTTSATGTFNINNATALGRDANIFNLTGGTTIDNTSGAAIAITNTNQVAVNGSFTFTGANDLSFAGPVTLGTGTRTITTNGSNLTFNGVVSGSAALTKNGVGTLTLAGANINSGATMISAGTLVAANTTGSATGTGAVALGATTGTVQATLAGGAGTSGILTGTVTTGGTVRARIAPGNVGNVGTLTLGTLTATAGATFALDLGATSGGTASDLLALTSLAAPTTGTGGLVFNLTDLGVTPGTTYTLVTFGSSTGLDAGDLALTGNAAGTLTFTNGEIDFTAAAAVPEPSTYAGVSLLLALLAWRERRRFAGAFGRR